MGLQGKLYKLRRYVSVLGSRDGLKLAVLETRARDSKEITIERHPGLARPITMRTRSTDFETFVQVIGEKEYDIPELSASRTIIDAGANIGLASRFFAQKYPNARIIALD